MYYHELEEVVLLYRKKDNNYLIFCIILSLITNKNYYIIIFTARFMGRSNDLEKIAIKKGLSLTKKQLKKWGVKYHKLKMGKPSYDIFVDDKSLFFKTFWINDLKKKIFKLKSTL